MARRRFKLTTVGPLLIGVILALSVGVLTVSGARTGSAQARQNTIDNEKATLATSARLLFNPLSSLDQTTLNNTLNVFLEDADTVYVVVRNVRGQVRAEAIGDWVPGEQISIELSTLALEQGAIVHRKIGQYLLLCGPIAVGSQQIGTLMTVVDMEQGPAAVSTYGTVIGVSVALVALTVLVIAVVARIATAPLRELGVVAGEIGRGNLDVPVPIRGTEETAVLGIAMERMKSELKALHADLEQQAAAQKHRARQFQITTEIVQAATAELDIDVLLQRAVSLISDRFGFYHASLHLLDETGDWVEMRTASSPGGQRVLERGLRLRLGESSIVGFVTKRGEHYLVTDVEADAIYLHHPDLPDTRSELALPLRARGDVLGALDVQSTMANAFSSEDVDGLQTLSNQIALAISNARLFRQSQENLETAQRAYGKVSYQAWSETLQARSDLGYYCDADGVTPVTRDYSVRGEEDLAMLNIPIMVRGQTIGVVRAARHAGSGDWTREDTALVETLTEQLNVALDSARLHQETQHRAAYERLISEATARIRESLDVETVTQRAAQELGQALAADTVTIQLGTAEQLLRKT